MTYLLFGRTDMPTRNPRDLEPENRDGVRLLVSAAVLVSVAAALAIGTSLERSTVLDAAPASSPAAQATPTSRPAAHPTPSLTSTAAPTPPDNSNPSDSNASGGGVGSGGGLAPPVVPPPVVPAPVLPPAPPPAPPPYTGAEARAAVLRWYPAVPAYDGCGEANSGTWGRTSDPPPPIYVGILGFEAGALADGLGGWVTYYNCE
jgi:hypothetical protein